MAIKVSRTHGLRVLYEKCGCTATREFEDQQLTKPVGDTATYVPCAKHQEAKESAETIQEILFEMLETAAMQTQRMPAPVVPNPTLGHSVQDVEAAQSSGGTGATRTPIRRAGAVGAGRTQVRRSAGDGGPKVSSAVMASRASGSASSLDAELARSPEPAQGARMGPVSREKVQEVMEEAAEAGEAVTPLDVLLGVNDPSEGR